MVLLPLPFPLIIACEVTVGYVIRIGSFILYLYVQSFIIIIIIIIIIMVLPCPLPALLDYCFIKLLNAP